MQVFNYKTKEKTAKLQKLDLFDQLLTAEVVAGNRKDWVDNSPPNNSRKHTDGGLAISISACEDNQMAADTSVRNFILILLLNN